MSPIENLAQRLANVQAAFNEAPNEMERKFPPDNDYQTLLHEFDFFEGGTPKQAFMKMVFTIVHDDDWAGLPLEKVYGLEDPERIGYLKADLYRLGVDTEKLDLATAISTGELQASLLDTPTLIRVKRGNKINPKTNQPYVGVYIQQKLGEPVRRVAGPERTGQSDIPETGEKDFVHPDQGTIDEELAKAAEERRLDDKYGDTMPDGDGENIVREGDETTPPSVDSPEVRERRLRELGCVCESPLEVDEATHNGNKGTGHVDCPVPGHAAF